MSSYHPPTYNHKPPRGGGGGGRGGGGGGGPPDRDRGEYGGPGGGHGRDPYGGGGSGSGGNPYDYPPPQRGNPEDSGYSSMSGGPGPGPPRRGGAGSVRGGGGGGGGPYHRGGGGPNYPPSSALHDRDFRRGPPPPPSHFFGGAGAGPPDFGDRPRRGSGGPPYGGGVAPQSHNNQQHPPHYQQQQHYQTGSGGPPPVPPPPNNSNSNKSNPNKPPPPHPGMITFRSYEEEREWLEQRRRKRKERPSLFDLPPAAGLLPTAGASTTLALSPSSAAVLLPAVSAIAAAAATTTTMASGMVLPPDAMGGILTQQTRHARRLYVGNLPHMITEEHIHQAFQQAIHVAWDEPTPLQEDPVLSVYMNPERRFAFVEFRTVEMATACMALDGLHVQGQPVKVKRPNDYNPLTAPKVHPGNLPNLNVTKLGIISSNVQDGPNKIFIGGLHYHLSDHQVLELLQAFGKVKAFHLVKNEPDSDLSKGYCFVEYVDPAVTMVAVQGLNGMDIGGGKSLTARLAGERGGMMGTDLAIVTQGAAAMPAGSAPVVMITPQGAVLPAHFAVPNSRSPTTTAAAAIAAGQPEALAPGMPPLDRNIVAGYDVEELVDAAMGFKPMPMAPIYLDVLGQPLTRLAPILIPSPLSAATIHGTAASTNTTPTSMNASQHSAAHFISSFTSASLQQTLASIGGLPPLTGGLPPIAATPVSSAITATAGTNGVTSTTGTPNAPTRILVLLNMVTDDDLATDDDYQGLLEEVREECAKFGQLRSIHIPRTVTTQNGDHPDRDNDDDDDNIIGDELSRRNGRTEPSALRKIFLEYATVQDAQTAQHELSGRQFGSHVVQASYYSERDYERGYFQ